MEKLVLKLKKDYPDLQFTAGVSHCWSPEHAEISYAVTQDGRGTEALLHELGHARLKHQSYQSDAELLQKEVEAWQEAATLAAHYGVTIDQEHIEQCLDSYRDWLHRRSACPACESTGLQLNIRQYRCINCRQTWNVTVARFKRPYRRSESITTKKSEP